MAIEPDPPRPFAQPPPASRPVVVTDESGASPADAPSEDLVPELSGHAPPPQVLTLREQAIRSGAAWLVWIAILSLVNVGATASGSDFSFALGLVVSQVIAAVGSGIATEAHMPAIGWIAAALGAVPALVFGALWFPAKSGKAWVFAVALVAYTLDLLALVGILLSVGEMDVIGVGIHVWALWALGRGWSACREPVSA